MSSAPTPSARESNDVESDERFDGRAQSFSRRVTPKTGQIFRTIYIWIDALLSSIGSMIAIGTAALLREHRFLAVAVFPAWIQLQARRPPECGVRPTARAEWLLTSVRCSAKAPRDQHFTNQQLKGVALEAASFPRRGSGRQGRQSPIARPRDNPAQRGLSRRPQPG